MKKKILDVSPHELDLYVPCPHKACAAAALAECLELPTGIVHFARRLKRLMAGLRATCEVTEVERQKSDGPV